jgi:ABC-type nitrate/sulfonate/bicarbonate transport system ATPase subunit
MGAFAIRLSEVSLTLQSEDRTSEIFSGLNLEVAPNELLTVVGASGAGKSTLLNLLAGFVSPNAGEVTYADDSSVKAIAFQQPYLYPWLSVRANIELGLRFKAQGHLNRKARHQHVEELIEILGLQELQTQRPANLSGGQAQRVSIARALAIQPNVLLLDEPFGALDTGTRHQLQDWLKEIQKRLGLTIVLVTHDLEEALYLGDRVALLSNNSVAVQLFESSATNREEVVGTSSHTQILNQLKAN